MIFFGIERKRFLFNFVKPKKKEICIHPKDYKCCCGRGETELENLHIRDLIDEIILMPLGYKLARGFNMLRDDFNK